MEKRFTIVVAGGKGVREDPRERGAGDRLVGMGEHMGFRDRAVLREDALFGGVFDVGGIPRDAVRQGDRPGFVPFADDRRQRLHSC